MNSGMFQQEPIVLNGYEDIPDYLIGSRFYFYTPEEYRKYGVQSKPSIPMSAPIGNPIIPQVNKSNIKTTMAAAGTAAKGPEVKSNTWTEKDIYGRSRPTNMAIGTMMGFQAGADVVGGIQAANTAQYGADVDYWNQQGKWWFDKNADFAPSFEEYAPNMPSAEQAVGGAGGAIGAGALKGGLSGAAVGTMIAPGVGTAVGAGVGALVGAIEGMFALGAAKDEDRKNKRNAQNEYKKQLKEWTYAMNSRLNQRKNVSEAEQKSFIGQAGQLSISRKKEKASTAESRRQAILQSIMGAGTVAQTKKLTNQSRWS